MLLTPHPSTPLPAGWRLTAQCDADPSTVRLTWTLRGDVAAITLPRAAAPAWRDGLWRHTCFELFVADPDGDGYREFNFSPSSEWAAYGFTRYREGMAAVELPESPRIHLEVEPTGLLLTTMLPRSALGATPKQRAARRRCALAAVLERGDGSFAYLALAHPSGPPDFHHRDGRVFELA